MIGRDSAQLRRVIVATRTAGMHGRLTVLTRGGGDGACVGAPCDGFKFGSGLPPQVPTVPKVQRYPWVDARVASAGGAHCAQRAQLARTAQDHSECDWLIRSQ